MTAPVRPDQLRISIEMGDDYQPSPELASAFEQLAAALADGEVQGYQLGNFEIQIFKSFSFDSAVAPAPRSVFRSPDSPETPAGFNFLKAL